MFVPVTSPEAIIFPEAFKKVVCIPALNVSNAEHASGKFFLKYNKLAWASVNPPPVEVDDPFVAVNTALSKMGKNSLGGWYDAIINK